MSYLIHFNRNHDPKNGRFTFGDGNGDGIINGIKNKWQEGKQRRAIARLERKDENWAKRNYNKFYKKAYKPVKKEMKSYVNGELVRTYNPQLKSGKMSKSFMNAYNQKLAFLMNQQVSNLPLSPSGRVVNFVAKRGDLGVYMALADVGYDMSKVNKGIYSSGKVAYRKNQIDMV